MLKKRKKEKTNKKRTSEDKVLLFTALIKWLPVLGNPTATPMDNVTFHAPRKGHV